MSTAHRELGEEVRRALGDGPSEARRVRQRTAFVQAAEGTARRSRGARRARAFGGAAVGLAAAAALALAVVRGGGERELTCRGPGGEVIVAGSYLRAEAGVAQRLSFSEGTTLDVEDGARLRVGALADRAARLDVERGRVSAEVTPGQGITWDFVAGPYTVRVVGTGLAVEWSPQRDALRVEVRHGAVDVRGGALGERVVRVTRGEALEASAEGVVLRPRSDEARVEPGAAAGAPAEPDEHASTPAPAGAEERGRSRRRAARPAPSPGAPISFAALARDGRYAEAVDAAEAEGFERVLAGAGAAELLLLSDAARRAGRPARVLAPLEAVRRRFAGTQDAASAAFRIGLSQLGSGRAREAAARFEEAARESRDPTLREQAMGRRIEALARAGDRARAADAARLYLQASPAGPHASAARRALESEEAGDGP